MNFGSINAATLQYADTNHGTESTARRGKASIETVLNDIMSLTKLNYNTCKIRGGLPVTLRFADAVGEILTAGPLKEKAPLPV